MSVNTLLSRYSLTYQKIYIYHLLNIMPTAYGELSLQMGVTHIINGLYNKIGIPGHSIHKSLLKYVNNLRDGKPDSAISLCV